MTTLRRRRGGDLRRTTGDGRNPPCVVDVAIASAVFQANPLSSSATVRTCGDVGQHDTGNTFGVSWREIGDRAKPRTGKDAACAICREEFKTNATSRGQVLTSCAHCFHDACLKSFEQFLASISEERRCPCCRRGYRKVRIDEAKKGGRNGGSSDDTKCIQRISRSKYTRTDERDRPKELDGW